MSSLEVKVLAVILAIVAVVTIVIYANSRGIDGLAVGSGCSAIGGLGGWLFHASKGDTHAKS